MSESKELTVANVVALCSSTRALLAKFGGSAFSRAKIRDALFMLNGGDVSAVTQTAEAVSARDARFDELANLLHDVHAALIDFERAPAGVGRAGAGKK